MTNHTTSPPGSDIELIEHTVNLSPRDRSPSLLSCHTIDHTQSPSSTTATDIRALWCATAAGPIITIDSSDSDYDEVTVERRRIERRRARFGLAPLRRPVSPPDDKETKPARTNFAIERAIAGRRKNGLELTADQLLYERERDHGSQILPSKDEYIALRGVEEQVMRTGSPKRERQRYNERMTQIRRWDSLTLRCRLAGYQARDHHKGQELHNQRRMWHQETGSDCGWTNRVEELDWRDVSIWERLDRDIPQSPQAHDGGTRSRAQFVSACGSRFMEEGTEEPTKSIWDRLS